MELQMDGRKEIIDTYSNNTKEWQEAQMKYDKLKGELEKKLREV